MSYILEALKKSEQERNPEQVPNLDTHHHHVVAEKKSKMPYWFLGIALLLINMVYIIYKMNQEPVIETVQTEKEIAPKKQAIVDSIPAPIAAKAKPIKQAPVQQLLTKQEPAIQEPEEKFITEQSPIIATRTLDRASLPDISELSERIQQQLPSLEFSTHIYIKEGGSFVIINGRSYGDGMTISQGLKVEKILTDGIVLVFEDQYFFLGSLVNW